MMIKLQIIFFLSIFFAHIGNPNTIFDTNAGQFQIRVIIKQPTAIPGNVDIRVRIKNGNSQDIEQVSVLPLRDNVDGTNEPPPILLEQEPNDKETYTGEMLLMTRGQYFILVTIQGKGSQEKFLVPYEAIILSSPKMSLPLKIFFLVSSIVFAISLIIVAGKIAGEGLLAPGQKMKQIDTRRRKRTMLIFSLLILAVGIFDLTLIQKIAQEHQSKLYKPIHAIAEVGYDHSKLFLTLRIDDPRWQKEYKQDPLVDGYKPLENYWSSGLTLEHGKWMHLVLVSLPQQDVFVHLHPIKINEHMFKSFLPNIPPGTYALYANITHENGFTNTLTDTVTIPESPPNTLYVKQDPDDSFLVASVDQGYTILFDKPDQITPKKELTLKFSVFDHEGKPAKLSPYMGMSGHSYIRSDDGGVFVHLHPLGTVSAGSIEANRIKLNVPNAVQHHHEIEGNIVEFPFAFPKAGTYRIWLQVKVNQNILTGVYEVHV